MLILIIKILKVPHMEMNIFFGQEKTRISVLLRETLIVQFLHCAGSRSEFKVLQMSRSQCRGIFVKKQWASRFLTLLNVVIRKTAESAEYTQTLPWSDLLECSGRAVLFFFFPGTFLHLSDTIPPLLPCQNIMVNEIKDYSKSYWLGVLVILWVYIVKNGPT